MNLELLLLNSLLNKTNYEKYKETLNDFFNDRSSQYYRIYQVIKYEYEKEMGAVALENVHQLAICFYKAYPGLGQKERDLYSQIFDKWVQIQGTQNIQETEALLVSLGRQKQARELASYLLGPTPLEHSRLLEFVSQFEEKQTQDKIEFVTNDIKEIYAKTYQTPGLRWNLQCLNKSLGSLRKGDFGFIFARPETGKTTFVASQISSMLRGMDGSILWFNNEQQGEVVKLRIFQAITGWTAPKIADNLEEAQKIFDKSNGDRILLVDRPTIHRREVEKIVTSIQPSLIIFDQIDKLKGFQDDRNDLELGSIYIWARELAKGFAPVIGVCQAGASGEDKRWLTMEDVVNAKTSKQAEADWILGIGKVFEPGFENVRFLSISKNKLLGDQDTIPELRHGKFEVMMYQDIARYEDIVKWKET